MKPLFHIIVVCLALILSISLSKAQSDPKWNGVTDPNELDNLIRGKALDGMSWIFYFRGDGKLASSHYDSMTVREWSITDEGEICYAVFSMPDKIIRCETIEKSTAAPPRYRMVTNIGIFEFEFRDPPEEHVKAIMDRAGPE